jgi:hypothetical protein
MSDNHHQESFCCVFIESISEFELGSGESQVESVTIVVIGGVDDNRRESSF